MRPPHDPGGLFGGGCCVGCGAGGGVVGCGAGCPVGPGCGGLCWFGGG